MHSLSSANLKGSILLANFKSSVGLIVRIRSTYCRAASSSCGRLGGCAQQERDQMPRIELQCILGPSDRLLRPSGQEVSDRAAWKPEKHTGIVRTETPRAFEHIERAVRLTAQGIPEAVAAANPY